MAIAGVSSSVSALYSLSFQAQRVARDVAVAGTSASSPSSSSASSPSSSSTSSPSAADVTSTTASSPAQAAPIAERDPAEALAELKQISIAYTANLKVITAADQMTSTLLDIKV